tara:strand:+ start:2168 stop:2587 length:420 start_codon:yes stop_codon:yes gene_type:complete
MASKEPDFTAPIPGQVLTAPTGDRPWQKPPQLTTVDEVAQFYIERLTADQMSVQIMDLLEMGLPVDTLSDGFQLGGVMEGIHSVDTGVLVAPIIMELISQMAEAANIDYKLIDEDEEQEIDEVMISFANDSRFKDKDNV